VRHLQRETLPEGVECLDGGTGSFQLLEPMHRARKIILIDAAVDDLPLGTVRRLQPRFSRDYPRTLTAHDIGLKDLLDTFYLLENPADVVLFAVTISTPQEIGLDLSPAIAAEVNKIVDQVLAEVKTAAAAVS
jgi:hydrogenase maturation protease